ncbi:MAG: polysaccharide deacetylase family protein, partial [Treponema sp.]|nr:polysaccharide deacetylase family protein [Treponema sp.]
PAERSSAAPSNLKWNGPGNLGWTVHKGDDTYAQFGGKAVEAPLDKWVDLTFSQTIDITNSGTGQIYMDGHNDIQGLIDLTLYIRNFKVTMVSTTKMVALTFNESPSDFTDYLIDKLEELNVNATFFVLGMAADGRHPVYDRNLNEASRTAKAAERRALVKRIHDAGNEIGVLPYTHSSVINYPVSEAGLRKELEDTRTLVQKAVYGDTDYQKNPWLAKLCRIPFSTDPAKVINMKKVTADLGFPIIGGMAMGDSNPPKNAEQTAQTLLSQVTPWTVIVGQDPRTDPSVMKVLDILVPKLQSDGYVFVTLSEMTERRGKPLTPGNSYDNLNPLGP